MEQQTKKTKREVNRQNRRRGFLNVFFSRTGVVLLLLLLQLVLLFTTSIYLQSYFTHYFAFSFLLGAIMAVYLINTPSNPSVKITWLILVLLLPLFGTLLYLYLHLDIGHRRTRNKIRSITEETKSLLGNRAADKEALSAAPTELKHIAGYLEKVGPFPAFCNADVIYYPSGEEKFEAVLAELRNAKKFIFLEYFIIEEGYMWGKVLDILVQKAQQGVTVRLLYDGTCEFFTLPHNYPKQLTALGIESKVFSPIYPFVSTQYNYRDHRKILIVDGQVAFTGGVNFADEYINRKLRFGHWKDVAIRVQGEAVRSFTLMFLQMWNINSSEQAVDYTKWLWTPVEQPANGTGFIIPYADCPLDDEKVGEMVYLDILGHAETYVHIITPYLILDGEMETALLLAAKRGIEVKLILPHIPDKKYAFALAKTHYKALTEAGVQIYEYTPGFVHAKVFVSDDKKAVVGTINLDYRSLYHHFECAAYLYDVPAIRDIERDFEDTLAKSQPVTKETIANEKLSWRIAGRLLKIVAPLM